MFSRRAGWDLTQSELAVRAAAARAAGRPLFDLTNANPASLPEPGAALARALAAVPSDPAARRYEPDARGERSAREAIAAYHGGQGARLDPDHVILSAGTSEGYAHLFRVLADPGDIVHLPTPGYPLFQHLAELEGVRSEAYRLAPPRDPSETRWRIDLDDLAASLGPRSRAVLVIHPHNPTGSRVDPADLAALRVLCAERGLALLSDEVFADSGAPGTARSALVDAAGSPLTVVLSGASKVLGVPQLKVAWLALGGAPELRDEALARLEFAADAYLAVSPLLARVLPALFAEREAIRAAIARRVSANRAALARALGATPGARLLPAEAGWAAILRIAGEAGRTLDEEKLALAALEQAGVLVHPGFLFDLEPEAGGGHLVAGLLAPEPEVAAGAAALAALLAQLPPEARA